MYRIDNSESRGKYTKGMKGLVQDGYRNSKRMAINGMVKRLCKEEDVGYVDLWDSFVGKEEMYLRDGLHLSGKGAAVFAEGLSGAVVWRAVFTFIH